MFLNKSNQNQSITSECGPTYLNKTNQYRKARMIIFASVIAVLAFSIFTNTFHAAGIELIDKFITELQSIFDQVKQLVLVLLVLALLVGIAKVALGQSKGGGLGGVVKIALVILAVFMIGAIVSTIQTFAQNAGGGAGPSWDSLKTIYIPGLHI